MISLMKLENSPTKRRERRCKSNSHAGTPAWQNPQQRSLSCAKSVVTAMCLTLLLALTGLLGVHNAHAAGKVYTYKPTTNIHVGSHPVHGVPDSVMYFWGEGGTPTTFTTGNDHDTLIIEINDSAGFNGSLSNVSFATQHTGANKYALYNIGTPGKVDTLDLVLIRVHSVTAATGAYKLDLAKIFGPDVNK